MPSTGAKRRKHSNDAKQRLVAKGTAPKRGPGSRQRWTAEDLLLILDKDFDVVALSKKLNRTVDAIYVKRSKMLRSFPVDEVICPECAQDKHQNCNGIAWDDEKDEPAKCECEISGHRL